MTPTPAGSALLQHERRLHKAIGLNFTDVYMRSGVHPVKFELTLQVGMEAAGVVDALGSRVRH